MKHFPSIFKTNLGRLQNILAYHGKCILHQSMHGSNP
jgi:hypothetical protein